MGRVSIYLRGVASGQLLLFVNLFTSLASVPIALRYLNVHDFGLWAVIMQLAGFFLLLDTGLSSALARLLIDVKDKRPTQEYGRMFVSAFALLSMGGLISVLTGWILAPALISLLNIPQELHQTASSLLIGQALICGISLPARTIGNCLTAYSRFDLLNLAFLFSLLASFVALLVSLYSGAGVFSLLWANGSALIVTIGFTAWLAWRRKLLPGWNEMGWPSLTMTWEVLCFGQNVFMSYVGGMILNSSQTILLTRFAGLEAAAMWAVGSKSYQLLFQVASKFAQSSGPIYSEMLVRGETTRLHERLGQLKLLTRGIGVVFGSALWTLNSLFVAIWTHNRIDWMPKWDPLLMILLLVQIENQSSSVYIWTSKQFGFFRFCSFTEAIVFIGLSLLFVPAHGIGGLLLATLLASLTVTTPYLWWREKMRSAEFVPERRNSCVFWICMGIPFLSAALLSSMEWSTNLYWQFGVSFVIQGFSSIPLVLFGARDLGLLRSMKN